ncbi:hypothetical protein K501DRAFT_274686 [Backusella circina FSU 941]|nr:hypothetical protein K501DRAFT_274686 [Backusella circina FSU 941]
MCDLNWCCVCDKAISCESDSLYCSQECFTKDATNKNREDHKLQYFLHPRIYKMQSSNSPPVPYLSPTFSCASDISSPTLSDKLIPFFDSEDVPKLTLGKSACTYCNKQEQHPKNTQYHQISFSNVNI